MRFKNTVVFFISAAILSACHQKPAAEKNTDAWYKHLLIYNLDVKTFKDSDGDGEGDFNGLTSKLDYLQSLGTTCIWLAPFQPSPLQDDGYDVTDYYGIDPKLGSQQDFKNFMVKAKAHHIKVIMDLVLNHTSIQHPWFVAASHDAASPRRNWYLWSAKKPDDWNKGMGFPVVEKETWTYNNNAKAYYFHRFYTFQPDLNFQNPAVEKEAERILGYWLDQGMDGFRLDAVPFIIDNPRKSAEKPGFDFAVLHQLCNYVRQHKPDAVLLGEANVEPDENKRYFGEHHDGLDMMFNFYANQFLFYGLATGDASLFKDALVKTQVKPPTAQWAWFLRNHDEIDLGRLSKRQINEAYQKFGPDTNMQLYKRGIRRRLAPMLGDDPEQLRMAYSLLFSLPGTPVIRSGEDIGMGDDLKLKERLSVRTPMQWDSTMNGGFSTAKNLFRPVINTGEYGYQTVNVAKEKQDPQSLLNFIQKMIRIRKSSPEIDNGTWKILDSGSDKVLVIEYLEKGKYLIVAHNFSEKPQEVSVKLTQEPSAPTLTDVLDGKPGVKAQDGKIQLKLSRYGFQWYRLN